MYTLSGVRFDEHIVKRGEGKMEFSFEGLQCCVNLNCFELPEHSSTKLQNMVTFSFRSLINLLFLFSVFERMSSKRTGNENYVITFLVNNKICAKRAVRHSHVFRYSQFTVLRLHIYEGIPCLKFISFIFDRSSSSTGQPRKNYLSHFCQLRF